MSDFSNQGSPTLFHDADEINTHDKEVVGFNDESLLVAVCRPQSPEFYDLEPVSPSEVKSASIRLVFMPFNIILGAIIAGLGGGWFYGFFMGWIPVLFYVIAGAMVLIGLGMMLVCFENRAYLEMRDGSRIEARGIGDHKQALGDWLRKRGVSVV